MAAQQLKLQQQFQDLGSKLCLSPLPSKDSLVKLLKQSATCLSEVEQSPPPPVLEAMQPLVNAFVKPELLKHQDREVNLLDATCICEITRITAPEAPYADDILKDIFHLIVGTFNGLSDLHSPFFGRRVVILENLAKYRPFVVMLDLDCDHLVKEIFNTFLAIVQDEHPNSVLTSMETILAVLFEEGIEDREDLVEDLVLIVLSCLGRNRKDVTPAARRLSLNVIERCHVILEPVIKQFLISSMSGDNKSLKLQIDPYEVIYDVYSCAPQALSGVVPYLTGELLTDELNNRLKAVNLIGEMFALPGSSTPETFQPLYIEYMKRLTDRAVEVRMTVLENINTCLLSDPCRPEAPQITAALCDRLLDYDENVRKKVVAVVCDMACNVLSSVPVQTIRLVAERLRDKSLLVKKYTMDRLGDIYKKYCLNCSSGSVTKDDYDWIPAKILRCFYDKDFRADVVEPTLCSLFPTGFSAQDVVKFWVKSFSRFDKAEIKALEKILEQKQRLQQEMQKYISLRQTYQDGDASEIQKKKAFCFRVMSRFFVDSFKAQESFQILDQLKDSNIWRILSAILDPHITIEQIMNSRGDLLRILSEKHRLYEFLSILSVKCSNFLFNKDHCKGILLEADILKSTGNDQLTVSCMSILVLLARFCPLLLSGIAEDLVHLLEDDNQVVKEGVLHVLAKAGGAIQEQLSVPSRSLDLMLERICLEGSRSQAKYAVHALASVTQDHGLLSLSVLYKRLVNMLQEKSVKSQLPAVLQSLGCIAQTAMSVFETRESEIEGFIRKNIFECRCALQAKGKNTWDYRSEECSLKIYGLKMLVKSYLPVKDAHLRLGIDELITTLKKFITFGELCQGVYSSAVDKAHMKLAAAKAVLRLAVHWDHKIPADVFCLTMAVSEDAFPQVRSRFLNKVHQYIKDRPLDPKYCCAFFLHLGSQKQLLEEDKHNIYDIIQTLMQGKTRQISREYIIPYLVHVIAHQPSFPNVSKCKDFKSYEPIYRQLHFFLSMLLLGNDDDKTESSGGKDKENLSGIVSIFQSIKRSEDIVNPTKSKNLYVVCDLGLSIIKHLTQNQHDLLDFTVSVCLPSTLYKPLEKKEGVDTLVGQSPKWLADESAMVYFQSLKMEANEEVSQEAIDDDLLGSEMPLAKILEHLKAKGAKARREAKGDPSQAGEENDNNLDVLKSVREVSSHNLGRASRHKSSNGHGDVSNDTRMDRPKRKRMADEPSNISLPKKRRPSYPRSKGTARKGLSLCEPKKSCDKSNTHSDERILRERINEPAVSSVVPKNSISKHKKKISSGEHDKGDEAVKLDKGGHKKSKNSMGLDGSPAAIHSDSTTNKKRKLEIVDSLEKSPTKGHASSSIDLIGSRIKIWWPKDRTYYGGVVKSFDSQKNKHVVMYDDGDVEVLRLDRERWEIVGKSHKKAKRSNPSKGTQSENKIKVNKKPDPSTAISSGNKLLNELSLSSIARGKRKPRKRPTHRLKIQKHDTPLDGRGSLDVSDLDSAKPPDHNVDSEKKQTSDTEVAEKDEGSVSDGKKNNTEDSNTDLEKSQDDERGSEDESAGDINGSSHDDHRFKVGDSSSDEQMQQDLERGESEEESSGLQKSGSHCNGAASLSPNDSAELLEDEPLSMWQRRMRK